MCGWSSSSQSFFTTGHPFLTEMFVQGSCWGAAYIFAGGSGAYGDCQQVVRLSKSSTPGQYQVGKFCIRPCLMRAAGALAFLWAHDCGRSRLSNRCVLAYVSQI